MDRAAEFIQMYNHLAGALATMAGADRSMPFSQLVERAGEKHTAVRSAALRLKDFGDLRNAIVHHRAFLDKVIAEPTAEAVNEFRAIVESIVNPRRLIPTFQRPVTVYSLNEPLVVALGAMRANDFSQVVVEESGALSLLTTEGVARWLEQQAAEDIISVTEATVGEAHTCDPAGSFVVMARDKPVFDAQDAFAPSPKSPRLFAVIITQTGKATEKPLGIVTPWDLFGPVGTR